MTLFRRQNGDVYLLRRWFLFVTYISHEINLKNFRIGTSYNRLLSLSQSNIRIGDGSAHALLHRNVYCSLHMTFIGNSGVVKEEACAGILQVEEGRTLQKEDVLQKDIVEGVHCRRSTL